MVAVTPTPITKEALPTCLWPSPPPPPAKRPAWQLPRPLARPHPRSSDTGTRRPGLLGAPVKSGLPNRHYTQPGRRPKHGDAGPEAGRATAPAAPRRPRPSRPFFLRRKGAGERDPEERDSPRRLTAKRGAEVTDGGLPTSRFADAQGSGPLGLRPSPEHGDAGPEAGRATAPAVPWRPRPSRPFFLRRKGAGERDPEERDSPRRLTAKRGAEVTDGALPTSRFADAQGSGPLGAARDYATQNTQRGRDYATQNPRHGPWLCDPVLRIPSVDYTPQGSRGVVQVCWSLLGVHSRPCLPGYHKRRLQNSKDYCLLLPLEASSQRVTCQMPARALLYDVSVDPCWEMSSCQEAWWESGTYLRRLSFPYQSLSTVLRYLLLSSELAGRNF
ncbi:uncharacterized protein [Chlorocebus sabaeus]|uniref:uncharacterized protein n=1 Tax=Chlorocebus sabaeus TaxID=60711 RepID=UPI003BF94959